MYSTLPLMILFLALRLYVRVRPRMLGPDDCMVYNPFPAQTVNHTVQVLIKILRQTSLSLQQYVLSTASQT